MTRRRRQHGTRPTRISGRGLCSGHVAATSPLAPCPAHVGPLTLASTRWTGSRRRAAQERRGGGCCRWSSPTRSTLRHKKDYSYPHSTRNKRTPNEPKEPVATCSTTPCLEDTQRLGPKPTQLCSCSSVAVMLPVRASLRCRVSHRCREPPSRSSSPRPCCVAATPDASPADAVRHQRGVRPYLEPPSSRSPALGDPPAFGR